MSLVPYALFIITIILFLLSLYVGPFTSSLVVHWHGSNRKNEYIHKAKPQRKQSMNHVNNSPGIGHDIISR